MKKSRLFYGIVMIFSLFLGTNQILSAQVTVQDSLALVALYDSTDGANWTNNSNWLSQQPVSNWYGISVSFGRVSRINLSLNNLVGTIPSNFCDLTELTDLNLERNSLSGSFPQEILSLINLTVLNIRNNNFTGSIPSNIDTLTKLTTLYLFNNPLTGHLPPELGNLSNLESVRISGTQIDGSIPPELGKLTNLTSLELRQNEISDSIPPELGNLTNLTTLALYGNELSGEIPVELGNLVNLRALFLNANQLTGSIPVEFGNLTLMENLRIEHNNLTGTIPAELGNLIKTYIMFLSDNQLSGPVPDEIGNLIELERFHIFDNELTSLPDLSTLFSLTELFVQNNKFTFKDIEHNVGFATSFIYSPQDSVGAKQDTTVDIGSSITFTLSAGGDSTKYQWMKDDVEIPGATDSCYTIDSVEPTDSGAYVCKATNTIATDLTLYSRPIILTVSGGEGVTEHSTSTPKAFALYQNYPNPFNPTTNIQYSIPTSNIVKLIIYDLNGRELQTLFNKFQQPGSYSIQFDASDFPSGIYFYTLRVGRNFITAKKMLCIK